MKILIKLDQNDSNFIALPLHCAAAAAELLANAKLYSREGWSSPATYKPSEQALSIEYVEDTRLDPPDPKLIEANDELQKARARSYDIGREKEAIAKELAETKAALAAIQSVTVCQQVAPELSESLGYAEADEARDE